MRFRLMPKSTTLDHIEVPEQRESRFCERRASRKFFSLFSVSLLQ